MFFIQRGREKWFHIHTEKKNLIKAEFSCLDHISLSVGKRLQLLIVLQNVYETLNYNKWVSHLH